MEEVWRTIPGVSDLYEVSNLGRVRSWAVQGKGGVRSDSPRLLKTNISSSRKRTSDAYPLVDVLVDGKRQVNAVHRLVMLAFVGPPPEGMEVAHLDSNPLNAELSNLRYVTKVENEHHKFGNGTIKLGPGDVADIRDEYARGGITQQVLASRYGVSTSTICRTVRGNRHAEASGERTLRYSVAAI